MIKQILKAVGLGYSSNSILNNLIKRFPQHASKINTALTYGYPAATILKKLVNPSSDASDSQEFLTEHEKTYKRDIQNRRKETNKVLGTLGTVGAIGVALNELMGSDGQNPLQEDLSSLDENPPSPSGTPKGETEVLGRSKKSPSPFSAENLSQQMQKANPKWEERHKFSNMLNEIDPDFNRKFIRELWSGRPIDETVRIFQNQPQFRSSIHLLEQQTGMNFSDIARRMHGDFGAEPMQESKEPETVPQVIRKGSLVSTNDGLIGPITDMKNTHSLLNVNGVNKQVKNDDLEILPQEWENIHVDLSKVPESDRSAPINFFAAPDDRSSAIVRFWQGHKPIVYQYYRKDGQPLDEDIIDSITNEIDAPITSGMKFSGAWAETGKSRGTALFHKLKMMAQGPEEPDDPSKPLKFRRIPIRFEHGFMKAYLGELTKGEGSFNEKYYPKKRKKRSK